jgi:uncharacterized protein (TIGR00661 family)
MAKVLVGLSGDGIGHSSRCRAIISHLNEQGHQVKIVTSGKGYEYLHDYYSIIKILGLRIVSDSGKVDAWKTLTEAFERLSKHGLKTFKVLLAEVESFQPDIIISDFEPFVVVIGARKHIPVLSVDNQHIIPLCLLKYPKAWLKEYIAAWIVCNTICSYSEHYFLSCFFQPKLLRGFRKKATQVGPILRKEILEQVPAAEDRVLVYIRTPERAAALLPLLEQIDGSQYCVYGFENAPPRSQHILLRSHVEEVFLNDLATAKAVITNGGHSLISEALYLGKPVFSIPTKGDFEQMINAYYVQRLGYGMYSFSPSLEQIQAFMNDIGRFQQNIQKDSINFNGNQRFFELLDSKIEQLCGSRTF